MTTLTIQFLFQKLQIFYLQITNAYNKLSPQKRSTKTLRIKFDNMKTRAKRAGDEYFRGIKRKKHEKLVEDSFSVSFFMKDKTIFSYIRGLSQKYPSSVIPLGVY